MALDARSGRVVRSFFAFDPNARGGVGVGSRDVNGDGIDDILAGAGAGQPPQVAYFDGLTLAVIDSFFAFDPAFDGGVFVG